MESVRAPSPIAEEIDDDKESSSTVYIQTIKRLIQRTQRVPELSTSATSQSFPSATTSRRNQSQDKSSLAKRDNDYLGVELANLNVENRSLYSLNEYSSTNNPQRFDDRASQFEFQCDNDISSTDAQAFEFVLPSNEEHTNRHPPPFARRYFPSIGTNNHFDQQDRLSGDLSDSSEPDLDTKWSWKSLKREFRLSHSESLFHLYQAKLQHSFFVALLILNIIFNIGAIISYLASVYQEINLCK